MFANHVNTLRAAAALTVLLASGIAQAQQPVPQITREELARLVEQALPPYIGSENSGLLKQIFAARLGPSLTKTFSAPKATQAIFGRVPPVFGPDCLRTGTPTGDPDQGDCTATRGEESGGGPFTVFSFSRNIGVGNIRYLARPTQSDLDPAKLESVKMDDGAAYDSSIKWLTEVFGLSREEFPTPPAGVKLNLPVSNLTIGFPRDAQIAPIVVQKVVTLRRGLFVDIRESPTYPGLPFIPAPGEATVLMNDRGVQGALVSEWQELRVPPNADEFIRNAKTRNELVEEIADDLFSEQPQAVGIIGVLIGLLTDWRGTFGYLVPAVQVHFSPIKGDLTPEELMKILDAQGPSTAGFVRGYPLYRASERAFEQR